MRIFIAYYVSEIEIKATVDGLEKSEVKKKGQERILVKFDGQEKNEVKVEGQDKSEMNI